MGWEFRFWVPLDDKLNVSTLFSGKYPEQRTDFYLAMRDEAVGVKIRNCPDANLIDDASMVEVKMRSDRDHCGAEQWHKYHVSILNLRNSAADGLVVPEGPAKSWPWVQCEKTRYQRWTDNVCVEQVDCELAMKTAGQEPKLQIRSICIEGQHPRKLYEAAAKVMGVGITGNSESCLLRQQLENTGFIGGYPSLVKNFVAERSLPGPGNEVPFMEDAEAQAKQSRAKAKQQKQSDKENHKTGRYRRSLSTKKKEDAEAHCEWCHEICVFNGGQCPAPGKGQKGNWCSRCVAEYKAWPPSKHTGPSGLLVGCTDADSGKALLLFGLERSGKWSHFNGNDDEGDRDNVMVACRETAEESCYALGAPRYLKTNFFDAGKVTAMFGGAWLADMGVLSSEEQEKILQAHHANRNGTLWRNPKRCELEMTRLQWCEAHEFLTAVENCRGKDVVSVSSLGAPFRSWTTRYYVHMSKKSVFREFCLKVV